MARISDQIPLGALKPPMQAGVNTVSRYLSQNRVMLMLTACWSAILLVAVLAMLSLVNPAAVNPIPSPSPELQVERPPDVAPTEPNPTKFENPRALWSLFTAMAAAGCMAGALIILLGLRRALIHNAVFQTSTAKAPRKAPTKVPKAPKVPAKAMAKPGQPRPARSAAPPTAQPAVSVAAGTPNPVPLHLVPPPVAGPFPNGVPARFPKEDAARMQPTATVHVIPPQPKRPPKGSKAAKAKAKAKASPPPKPVAQPLVVATQTVPPPGSVPPSPPAIPKVAFLQKAAQKKAARKHSAAQQANTQARAGKPLQKGHQPSKASQAARQRTPPPILSSLQAGVTIVPAEQTHPLDWHEHGIVEAMDMRKRRPLSSLMMRRQ
ncbi:hypothetical protein [Trichothermofontia sp.]